MERNLILIRLIYGFRYFMVYVPILVIFMEAHNISFTDFFVTQAVFAAAYAIVSIPCGYLSDRIGWKNSMIIASLLNILATSLYAFWFTFPSFLIAEALYGIAFALFNGSEVALLYESLVALGRRDEYKQQQGTCEMWGRVMEGIACIIGGLIAADAINLPFYVQFGVAFILIFLVTNLKKVTPPAAQDHPKLGTALHNIFIKQRPLRWIIIYSSIIGFATLTAVWMMQPYFKQQQLSLVRFGFGWAIMNFCVGIGAQIEPKIERMMGLKRLIISIPIVIAVGLLCFGLFKAAAVYIALLIISLMRGFKVPLVMSILNHAVPSSIRATAVNSESLLMRILFAIITPWIGYLADSTHGLSDAFYVLMAVCVLVGIAAMTTMPRFKRQ